jgi:hypothetical protein
MLFHTVYEHRLGNRQKIRLLPVIIVIVVLVVIGITFRIYWQNAHNPIPVSFRKEISFPVFYPSDKSSVTVNRSSFKYDSSNSVFIFTVTDAGQSLTIAEQATPQSFVDVPQAYTTLVNSLNNYSSFDSLQGQVDLTYPKQFSGQQSAVMNAKGTLMFVHDTDKRLSNSQWQHIFNNLNVIQ